MAIAMAMAMELNASGFSFTSTSTSTFTSTNILKRFSPRFQREMIGEQNRRFQRCRLFSHLSRTRPSVVWSIYLRASYEARCHHPLIIKESTPHTPTRETSFYFNYSFIKLDLGYLIWYYLHSLLWLWLQKFRGIEHCYFFLFIGGGGTF